MALAMEQGKVSGHTGAGPSTMSLLVINPSELGAAATQQSTPVRSVDSGTINYIKSRGETKKN